jgi:predicted Zn-dependent protease
MIDGIIYGEDPRQGYVENYIFYHPELRFQFPVPRGWKTENSPQQFAMGESNGKAIMILNLGQGQSLDAAAQQTVEQYKLNVLDSRRTTINGMQAIELVADMIQDQQSGQQSQPIRWQVGLISYGSNIYRFFGLSSVNDFSHFQSQFTQVIRSFSSLNDPSKINRQPERIRVRAVNQTTSLQNALRSFGVPADRLSELAIVNGMNLNENVPQGTLIKTIGQ